MNFRNIAMSVCFFSIPLAGAGNAADTVVSEHTLGDVTVNTIRIFSESFENLGNWKNLAPRSVWTMEDRILKGRWAPGGSEIWLDREFDGNILVVAEGKVLLPDPSVTKIKHPEGGKNFNIRFHVRGPGDVDILDAYQDLLEQGTGPNGIGDDQYWGYFVTWTRRHSRLRKSPGYINVSESKSYLPVLNRKHAIQLLFLNGRILYTVDDNLLHDYLDTKPFSRGKIAILIWNNNIEVSKFEVYTVVGPDDGE